MSDSKNYEELIALLDDLSERIDKTVQLQNRYAQDLNNILQIVSAKKKPLSWMKKLLCWFKNSDT